MNGLPEFGDLSEPVFNPLVYPRRVLISVLESYFSQDVLSTSIGTWQNRFKIVRDSAGELTKATKLVIADSFSEELTKSDPRPTIIVSRGTFGFMDTAIDNRRPEMLLKRLPTVSPDQLAIGYTGRTQAKYSDLTIMPISIECYARQAVEVDQLAWLVAGFFKIFSHQIRDGARFHKIGSPNIGPPSKYKGDSKVDLLVASIVLTVQQTYVWDKHTMATVQEILASSPEFSNESNKQQPQVYGTEATVIINTD
jgi:hypothetical protein